MEQLDIKRQLNRLETHHFILSKNHLNYESEVATYIIPAEKIYEVPDDFIGLKLMTKETHKFTTGTGVTTHTITLHHDIARDNLIPLEGANVIVVRDVPAPRKEWPTANYTVTLPRTVKLTGLVGGTAYTFDFYYLFGAGSVNITVESADELVKTKILEGNIRGINMKNQENVRAGLKPGMVGLCIPEKFSIKVNVVAPTVVCFRADEETAFSSPFARESFISLPVNISDLKDWPENMIRYAKEQIARL